MLLNAVHIIIIHKNCPLFHMRVAQFLDDEKKNNDCHFQGAEYYKWILHPHQHWNKAKYSLAFAVEVKTAAFFQQATKPHEGDVKDGKRNTQMVFWRKQEYRGKWTLDQAKLCFHFIKWYSNLQPSSTTSITFPISFLKIQIFRTLVLGVGQRKYCNIFKKSLQEVLRFFPTWEPLYEGQIMSFCH